MGDAKAIDPLVSTEQEVEVDAETAAGIERGIRAADEGRVVSASIKVHYLDASALVKLVADADDDDPDEQPGREVLHEYLYRKDSHEHAHMYATSLCVTEALGVFKRKFLKGRITEDKYIKYVRATVLHPHLQIDEVPIRSAVSEAERLIKKYKIDFIDCFQIVTMLRGQFHVFGPESKSILITADRDLAKAAREEGARVWECTTEPAP